MGAREETDRRRLRVLVAEDGGAFRRVLVRILSEAGHEVVALPDGDLALERLVEDERRFDALVTDVMMPGLAGTSLVRRMRERMEAPPPVVFVSGEVSPALNDQPGMIGADEILEKPFDAAELLAALDRIAR